MSGFRKCHPTRGLALDRAWRQYEQANVKYFTLAIGGPPYRSCLRARRAGEATLIQDQRCGDALNLAFRRACAKLKVTGSTPMIEIVALRVLELARAGESDPDRLLELTVATFEGWAQIAEVPAPLRDSPMCFCGVGAGQVAAAQESAPVDSVARRPKQSPTTPQIVPPSPEALNEFAGTL
jgi:hypothetical protein